MLALLVAGIALGACVGGASANRLSLSSTTWRAVFSEPVGEPPIHVIACAATFEGSFHSATLAKTISSLIGYITRAAIREETCRGGHLRALRETLPWHLRYEGFEGTLPIIRAIAAAAIGVAILAEFAAFPGSSCLIRSSAEEPVHIIFPRNTTTGVISFRFDETRFIRTTGICPESFLGLFGTTLLTVLGTTADITMTLI